ncbi:hypothetical protein A1O7_05197 [Cladophialophora yegresii CBS 114405]|uniref:Aminoglycoside phosphotransferase domain-containing protein n=1 Tax=Cladophialophora yegresii CBS 114405 TaxID=1182544 RepID=W9WRR0_9EURO|nr:uncharacterized protein A1O7_05197 [Cladophialophora yegresii CBS 114405]EXJ61044.1 hypothetical protein A1O7_05197 [Cladophialophora yegresii CBS 114405]
MRLSIGYLLMENMHGVSFEGKDWNHPDILCRVVTALNAVNSISGRTPGSVSGGESHGCLWPEDGSWTAFHNSDDLQWYLNERLVHFQSNVIIREADLRLCHMDVAPRKFLIDSQNRLWLFD